MRQWVMERQAAHGKEHNDKRLILLHPLMVRKQVANEHARILKRRREVTAEEEVKMDDGDLTKKLLKNESFQQQKV